MNAATAREHLEWMHSHETGMWNIAPAEGEYLCNLVAELGATRILEIGTSNGYSAIWLALGASQTGGTVVSIEADAERHHLALANLQKAGALPYVDCRLGDALELVANVPGPLDVVLIDAWKEDYAAYLQGVMPKVRGGGIILAHNMESHRQELSGFRALLLADCNLATEFVNLGPGGFSVSRVHQAAP